MRPSIMCSARSASPTPRPHRDRLLSWPGRSAPDAARLLRECYRILFPFCPRYAVPLWTNHRWGVFEDRTRNRNRRLAVCYNEHCLELELNRLEMTERTSWYRRDAEMSCVVLGEGRFVDAGRPIRLPEDFIRLNELERDHPARRYVRGCGFDPDILYRLWEVGYSARQA